MQNADQNNRAGIVNTPIQYRAVENTCADFICLSSELDEFLDIAIGGAGKRGKYQQFNHLDTMDYSMIAYVDGIPAGCGALREYVQEYDIGETDRMDHSTNKKSKTIELKRVFVREEYRNRGIGSGILQHLIRYARTQEYQTVILETGEFLDASCQLYARFGFERITNYGAYADMPESLCMAKKLEPIRYSMERNFSVEEVRDLYRSVGWLSADYAERLVQAFQKAGLVISAWEGDRLVGLLEAIDDREMIAYIHYLLVRPEYQNQGIGRQILALARDYYQSYLYLLVISEKKETVGFYETCGFTGVTQAVPLQILQENDCI